MKKVKLKFTENPRQRYPGDRKWKNPDVPKKEEKDQESDSSQNNEKGDK